jgi:hypothetical protein
MNNSGQDFKYYEGDKIRRPPAVFGWVGVVMFLAGLGMVAISTDMVICGAPLALIGVIAVFVQAVRVVLGEFAWTHDTEARHRAAFQQRADEGDAGAAAMLEGEKGYKPSRIPGPLWALLALVLLGLACAYGPWLLGLEYK